MSISQLRGIMSQYRTKNFKFKLHSFFRVILCPFRQMALYLPAGADKILDLGCGYGLWLNYLSLMGKKNKMVGVDIDKNKIDIAKTSINKNIDFINSDIMNFEISYNADCITILDTLYLVPFAQQEFLLRRCYKALDSNGYIFIKETEKAASWRFYLNIIQEFLSVKILRITQGEGLFWQDEHQFINMLNRANFKNIVVKKIEEGYFHPHILYIARKLDSDKS